MIGEEEGRKQKKREKRNNFSGVLVAPLTWSAISLLLSHQGNDV